MEPNKEDAPTESAESTEPTAEKTVDSGAPAQEAPADALSMTPDELEEEKAAEPIAAPDPEEKKPKKVSKLRLFFKRINVYLLMFILVLVVAAVIIIVYYFNSQKTPVVPGVASQELTEEALKDLANTDASVGSPTQTLTIQGNAIIDGQTLMRGNLNVAGNLQTGGSIQGPTLTISGQSTLGDTQINTLQVASNTAIQGNTTLRDLSVSGSATFNGAVTASQITATRLILSGDAVLEIPNHISFTGPAPSRTINSGQLGSGGSASVSGSDSSGTVNITTGNSPSAGCMVRINFAQRLSGQPRVIISPVGAGAGLARYYTERDQAGFSICSADPAPANQAFAFDYFVMN